MKIYNTLNDVYSALRVPLAELKDILHATGYDEYQEISINSECSSAQDRFLYDSLYDILHSIDDAVSDFKYLSLPVADEGYLHKNSAGRYKLNNFEFSCGCSIEIFCPAPDPDFPEDEKWISTRIEHDGNDYYAVGLRDFPLEGCKARRR